MDFELSRYLLWREYFLEVMMLWKNRRPRVWRETIRMFGIDEEEEGASTQLREALERKFALSAYLSLNVVESVCDAINIHQTTWLSLLVVLASFVVVHRFLQIGLLDFTWVFLGVIILIMLGMVLGVRRRLKKIDKFMVRVRRKRDRLSAGSCTVGHTESDASGDFNIVRINSPDTSVADLTGYEDSDSEDEQQSYVNRRIQAFHHKFPTERLIMRFLQIFLFLKSYIFSRTILDFHGWYEDLQQQALLLCAFAMIFFVLAWWLKNWIPTFLAVMALPPYVDKTNLQLFWAVLANDDDSLVPCLKSFGLGQDTPLPTPQVSPLPEHTLSTIDHKGHNIVNFGLETKGMPALWAEMGRQRQRIEALERENRGLEELGRIARLLPPEPVQRTSI